MDKTSKEWQDFDRAIAKGKHIFHQLKVSLGTITIFVCNFNIGQKIAAILQDKEASELISNMKKAVEKHGSRFDSNQTSDLSNASRTMNEGFSYIEKVLEKYGHK